MAVTLLALAPSWSASAGPVDVPAARGVPLFCVDAPCEVASDQNRGFLPPALVVSSGGTVRWSSADGTHVNAEDVTGDVDFAPEGPCFLTAFSPGAPGEVTFTLRDDRVFALDESGVERACTTAVALSSGAGVVHYNCRLHASSMKGVLVIVPA